MSKLRNTPAALLGPFMEPGNKRMRIGMRRVVYHEAQEEFLQYENVGSHLEL